MDDWGADFVGGLCLTPKTGGGGSMWGHPELDGYGGENREREGHEVRGRCSEPFVVWVTLALCVGITDGCLEPLCV